MQPLLGFLEPLGVLPTPPLVQFGPVEGLLVCYRDYLLAERDQTVRTVRGYVDCVRPFVAGRARGDSLDLAGLDAADVNGFRTGCPPRVRCRVGEADRLRVALTTGLAASDRSRPGGAGGRGPVGGRLATVGHAQGLEPGGLLRACARRTPTGRRDHAFLLLLSRLGLRAGEVAGLGLDDVAWRRGELVTWGKGNRAERLPLPAEAGAAIAAHLRRGRPDTAQGRNVFVRVHAPHRTAH